VAYRMAQLPMTLSMAEGHFAVLNRCNTHNLGNVACFNSACLNITWKVLVACDLNIIGTSFSINIASVCANGVNLSPNPSVGRSVGQSVSLSV